MQDGRMRQEWGRRHTGGRQETGRQTGKRQDTHMQIHEQKAYTDTRTKQNCICSDSSMIFCPHRLKGVGKAGMCVCVCERNSVTVNKTLSFSSYICWQHHIVQQTMGSYTGLTSSCWRREQVRAWWTWWAQVVGGAALACLPPSGWCSQCICKKTCSAQSILSAVSHVCMPVIDREYHKNLNSESHKETNTELPAARSTYQIKCSSSNSESRVTMPSQVLPPLTFLNYGTALPTFSYSGPHIQTTSPKTSGTLLLSPPSKGKLKTFLFSK